MRTIENINEKVLGSDENVTETKLIIENLTKEDDVHESSKKKDDDGDSFTKHLDTLENQKTDENHDDDEEFDIEDAFERM